MPRVRTSLTAGFLSAVLLSAAWAIAPSANAAPVTAAPASTGRQLCKGAGGVATNIVAGVTGALSPAILGEAELGTPTLDGNVVTAEGSVPFYSWGACGNQVAFQMQTKVCGAWGCHWVTRNHGVWEFFWAHDDTGVITQQVGVTCRPGTNSYRLQMAVIGLSSTGDVDAEGTPEAIGAELENDTETSPATKITC